MINDHHEPSSSTDVKQSACWEAPQHCKYSSSNSFTLARSLNFAVFRKIQNAADRAQRAQSALSAHFDPSGRNFRAQRERNRAQRGLGFFLKKKKIIVKNQIL